MIMCNIDRIEIIALNFTSRMNGVSYFGAQTKVYFKDGSFELVLTDYQTGYNSMYINVVRDQLLKLGYITGRENLYNICIKNNILLDAVIYDGKQREAKAIGRDRNFLSSFINMAYKRLHGQRVVLSDFRG